jgi:hypothetical protein
MRASPGNLSLCVTLSHETGALAVEDEEVETRPGEQLRADGARELAPEADLHPEQFHWMNDL